MSEWLVQISIKDTNSVSGEINARDKEEFLRKIEFGEHYYLSDKDGDFFLVPKEKALKISAIKVRNINKERHDADEEEEKI